MVRLPNLLRVKTASSSSTEGKSCPFSVDSVLFKYSSSHFTFVGTNAYWLPTLNNDQDIDNTLANIAANKIKVVRIWGFNGSIDVHLYQIYTKSNVNRQMSLPYQKLELGFSISLTELSRSITALMDFRNWIK
jgi:hypothetical protein